MLVVDRVKRSFGTVEAVRNVSFTAERGSILGLLGPNGAGKTTTMRMILGIYAPDEGTITWNGRSIDLSTRRHFGYLPEERGLYGKMRVREQITYFGQLHGLSADESKRRANEWMKTLRIDEYASRPCGELSKGNQQKVQLASAVLHEPELLVLDEPFSGLDPVNAETILTCLRTLATSGTTLVLSSHQMFVIEHACRAFCIVAAGAVRASGTLATLRGAFPRRGVRVAPDLPAIRSLFATRGAAAPVSGDDGALIYDMPATTDFGALLRDAVAVAPVDSFERHEPTLNQIYLHALSDDSSAP